MERKPLTEFTASHIKEDCQDLSGQHEKALFFGCTFDKLKGLTLKDCDLSESKFVTSSIKDALGFTLTLDCKSFRRTRWSPLLFELLLCLMASTLGNDDKRDKVVEIIGQKRFEAFSRLLKNIE